jgi:hypothetical protein
MVACGEINHEKANIILSIGWIPSIVFSFNPFAFLNDYWSMQMTIIKFEYVF